METVHFSRRVDGNRHPPRGGAESRHYVRLRHFEKIVLESCVISYELIHRRNRGNRAPPFREIKTNAKGLSQQLSLFGHGERRVRKPRKYLEKKDSSGGGTDSISSKRARVT